MAHWPFCYFGKYLIFCWLFVKTLTIEVKHAIVSFLHGTSKNPKYHVSGHSLEKIGLCSMKMSNQMLQNLLCSWKKKTHVVFFIFHFEQLYFSPYECPGLCQNRPGYSKGKNEKKTWVFIEPVFLVLRVWLLLVTK